MMLSIFQNNYVIYLDYTILNSILDNELIDTDSLKYSLDSIVKSTKINNEMTEEIRNFITVKKAE